MKQAATTFKCSCGKEYAVASVGPTIVVIDAPLIHKVVDAMFKAVNEVKE